MSDPEEMETGDKAAEDKLNPTQRRSCSSREFLRKKFGCPPPWTIGVINPTPNSFSDGGKFAVPETASAHAQVMHEAGINIVEFGGESTGPGREPVSAAEELGRIGGLVQVWAGKCVVSVDTYKAETAAAALEYGAQMINDVSAFRADPELASVVAGAGALCALMYSKEEGSHPHAVTAPKDYQDVTAEIIAFLEERVNFAFSCGIKQNRIIIDPGMGLFISPDPAYSWRVLEQLGRIREHFPGFAIMIGTSRKSFLGGSLKKRDPLSQLTGLGAWLKGADLIRTHDPVMFKQFYDAWLKMFPGAMPGGA